MFGYGYTDKKRRNSSEKIAEMGYEISQEKPRIGKDWNEYLQKRKTLEEGDGLSNINCDPSISIPKNFKEEFST